MDDINDISDTIDPKSSQLNYDDLAIIPSMTIIVTGVKRGSSREQPISIEFEGMESRPYKPCLSMRRVLIAAWGSDGRTWIGRGIKLYADHSVTFGGQKVGGIRISALSDIEKPIRLLLSTSKAKRSEYNINKLAPYPNQEFEQNSPQWVTAIKENRITLHEVIEKGSSKGFFTEKQIETLKKGIE